MFKALGTFRSKLPAKWEIYGISLFLLATAPVLAFFYLPDVVVLVAIVAYVVSIPTFIATWKSWKKWSGKSSHEPDWGVRALLFVLMISPLASLLNLGVLEALHYFNRPTYAALAPTICVNRTPTEGFTGPYPEVWNVDFWVLTSVEVCQYQLPHGFQVEGIRVRLDDGIYRPWVEYHGLQAVFTSPGLFNPGTCLDVELVGREMEYYKQNFPIGYRICRSWRTYADIIQYLQLPHRGFDQLDWDRTQSVGLVIADHGAYLGDGTTNALYVRYADDSGDGPVFLDFSPCVRLEGNIYGFLSSPASRRIRLEVPNDGGQILVKSWDSGEVLMTCTVR